MTTFPGLRVLVADDEPVLRMLLAEVLREAGFEADTADGALEAVAKLEKTGADLVFADVRMPGGSGVQILHWAKGRAFEWPVILMSGVDDVAPEAAYHMGADAVLVKPFSMDDMLATAQRVLADPSERWAAQPVVAPAHSYGFIFPSLAAAEASGLLAFGRGGFFLATSDVPPVDERAAFVISFRSGQISRLTGEGLVRWSRPISDRDLQTGFGLEITWLDEESRAAVLEDGAFVARPAFIPIGLRRPA